MTEEIALVKKKIYDDIVVNKAETVYDPDSFREFCISAGATKLFDTILDSVTGSLIFPHTLAVFFLTQPTSLTKSEMCSSTVLHVYKNLSESRAESILLKQQLQHKCSNSCHTANNVPQQKYEDDCFTFRVNQAGSNKKMWFTSV